MSAPIVAPGVIYGRGRNGSIVAVDAKTGRELWVREEGRKLEGMIMVELDSGGQMPYTPREAAQTAHDWSSRTASR